MIAANQSVSDASTNVNCRKNSISVLLRTVIHHFTKFDSLQLIVKNDHVPKVIFLSQDYRTNSRKVITKWSLFTNLYMHPTAHNVHVHRCSSSFFNLCFTQCLVDDCGQPVQQVFLFIAVTVNSDRAVCTEMWFFCQRVLNCHELHDNDEIYAVCLISSTIVR